jgi:hypothetical protein
MNCHAGAFSRYLQPAAGPCRQADTQFSYSACAVSQASCLRQQRLLSYSTSTIVRRNATQQRSEQTPLYAKSQCVYEQVAGRARTFSPPLSGPTVMGSFKALEPFGAPEQDRGQAACGRKP